MATAPIAEQRPAETIHQAVKRLDLVAGGLSILGAAIDAELRGEELHPLVADRVAATLKALGVEEAFRSAGAAELEAALKELKALWYLNSAVLEPDGRQRGWAHTDPRLLQTIGSLTHNLPGAIANVFAPHLDDLVERLKSPGASFLDVGSGVGALSIEMVQTFEHLRAVGVDPWKPSMDLARQNVAGAGLEHRIELREQGGEEIDDEAAFDLAWIASPFMPEEVVPRIVERVLNALRPGGWLFLAAPKPVTDPLAAAVWSFRGATFGGAAWHAERATRLFEDVGYAEVRTLPSPPSAVASIIAARRGA